MKKIFFLLLLILPTITFSQKKYKEGYYSDKEMSKIAGLIKLRRASFSVFGEKPTSIKFKKSGQKTLKLGLDDMNYFVIEQDSFTVISNFKINSINGDYEQDFVKVIEVGKINLYMHYSASSDGQTKYLWNRYVINKSGSNENFGVYDWVEHKQHLLNLIGDNSELVSYLKSLSKKEWISKIPDIVRKYNSN